MAVQTEEKETHDASHVEDHHLRYPEVDEVFERKQGMRIAYESLVRDVLRYGGQAAIVLALVGAFSGLAFWGASSLHFLPGLVNEIAKPFLPAPQAPVVVPAPKATEVKIEKPHVAQAPRHRHKTQHKASVPGYDYRRGGAPYSSNPAGGQIIYQDSMITEYRWNK